MRSRPIAMALAALLLLVACRQADAIPAGARVVDVTVTDDGVLLEPATVAAGDVYLVVEPSGAAITFVARSDAPGAPIAPLDDAGLARLARGDTFHTSATGFGGGGCDAGQIAADRGRIGPCGNVMQITVPAGRYAIVRGSPDGDGGPPAFAILTVTP